jgi:CBS domain-containing protein
MRVLDPVSLILRKKGCEIWSVPSDATVYSAMQIMAEKNVGALLVIDQGRLAGVISERDYARKVILLIGPGCSVDEAMRLMTTSRMRHLPVVSDGDILGIISIGDLVNWIAFAQDHTIEQLEHYIEGKYPC